MRKNQAVNQPMNWGKFQIDTSITQIANGTTGCGAVFPGPPQWLATVLVWAMLLIPNATQAGVVLSLQASGNVDLMNLQLGQTATIDVELEGLAANEDLFYLAATVEYEAVLLGNAEDVIAGAIIPDPDGFLGFGDSGLVDGFYDVLFTLSNLPISETGTLFSFSVTAQQVGTGNFSFMFGAARNLLDEEVSVELGGTLPFEVVGSAVQIPEPSTWQLYCLFGTAFRMRRHRTQV